MTALIELDRAGMVFDAGAEKIRALEPLDLSIGAGQFLAVVGPSGCGKSTLMRLLTGLTRASEGEIRIEGDVLSGPARDVGMAFQNASLMPWRTTLDNIMISFEVSPAPPPRIRQGPRSLRPRRPRHSSRRWVFPGSSSAIRSNSRGVCSSA